MLGCRSPGALRTEVHEAEEVCLSSAGCHGHRCQLGAESEQLQFGRGNKKTAKKLLRRKDRSDLMIEIVMCHVHQLFSCGRSSSSCRSSSWATHERSIFTSWLPATFPHELLCATFYFRRCRGASGRRCVLGIHSSSTADSNAHRSQQCEILCCFCSKFKYFDRASSVCTAATAIGLLFSFSAHPGREGARTLAELHELVLNFCPRRCRHDSTHEERVRGHGLFCQDGSKISPPLLQSD